MVEKISIAHWKWVIIWLIIGCILRIAAIHFYVPLINQDELSNLYDAISLVETGKDRFETPSPFVIRGFGAADYRPPLFIWIEAILYKFFSINEYGARYISFIFGILGILYSFLLIRKLMSSRMSYMFLGIMVLSPIHILFSSIAFESATLSSCLFIIGLYYFVLFHTNGKKIYLFWSSVFAGLCTSTYQSYKLTSFLFIVYVMYYLWKTGRLKTLYLVISGSILGALPQLALMLTYPSYFFARFHATVSSNHKEWYEYIWLFPANFFHSFNPYIWFFNLDRNYNLVNVRFLAIQFPLFILGLYYFLYKQNISKKIKWSIAFIYIASAAPEMISLSSLNLYRNNLIPYFMGLIISLGLYYFIEKYRQAILIYTLVVINFIIYLVIDYKNSSRPYQFQNEYVQLYKKLALYQNNYSHIYLLNSGNQPYIYLLYYCRIRPRTFQTMKKEIKVEKYGWDDVQRLGKFQFISEAESNDIDLHNKKELLISRKLIHDKYSAIDSVVTQSYNFYFYQRRD